MSAGFVNIMTYINTCEMNDPEGTSNVRYVEDYTPVQKTVDTLAPKAS